MSITEVVGLEGSSVVLEEIFRFKPGQVTAGTDHIEGNFITAGLMKRSVLVEKSRFFGLSDQLDSLFQARGYI
jgi:pilus assembly protein CpaF